MSGSLRSLALGLTALMTFSLPAVAQQVRVSVDQVPTSVAPGQAFDVVWSVTSPDPIQLTTVVWGTASRTWTQIADLRSGPPGSFRTRITAPAQAGKIYYAIYVRTSAVRGTTAERQLDVGTVQPPPPPPPTGFGLTQRVAPNLNIPLGGGTPDPYRTVVAFPNLTFDSPVDMKNAGDGTNRLFVVEQGGRILVFPNDANVAASRVFLDIRGRVRAGGEEGLLGLAFPPDYATTRRFYVYYTPNSGSRRTVVSRFLASATNPDQADPQSEQVLLQISQPFSNHNGGSMAFGQDGMLYVGTGDGGSGGDPMDNAQNKGALLGKILRLDVSGQGAAIPADNPFRTEPGARGEIWALGIRNPWRFSFDRRTGELWVGDVGQNEIEEVDVVTRGGNYGWPVFEAGQNYRNPSGFPASAFQRPITSYPHSQGYSITGGYVYRGDLYPALRGVYVYADYGSGRVWALRRNAAGTGTEFVREIATARNPSAFGEDEQGELYIVSHSVGRIFRLEPQSGGGQSFPTLLSQTRVFSNLANLTPAAGLIEYDVNAPLWSDGAIKRRWIALPGTTTKIGFSREGNWTFPTGTVLVKHFELELTVGNPGTRKRLETRLLVNDPVDGWTGYTYRWNDQGTDATLLSTGETAIYQVREGNTVRNQEWYYPSRVDCMNCHTQAAGSVLGPRTLQLNRDFAYASMTDNQLRSWNHIGLFDQDIGAASGYRAYPDPHGAGSLTDRSRAYLASNCSHCHQPGGGTPRQIDLRYQTSRADTKTIDEAPLGGDLGLTNARIIRAGVKESSVLWERMRRRDFRGMPPIGTRVVDDAAVDLIGRWIDGGAN